MRVWLCSVLLAGVLFILGDLLTALMAGDRLGLRRPRRPLHFEFPVLAIASIAVLVMLRGALMRSRPSPAPSLDALETIIGINFLILAVLVGAILVNRINRLADYGVELTGGADEIRWGAVGYLMAVPLVLLLLVLTQTLRTEEVEHPFLKLLRGTHSERALIDVALAAVVSAPLAEEFIFRVVIQSQLEIKLGPWPAILVTALAFAGVHGWPECLPLFPLAMVLGMVYHVRRSYVAVVTLHAMFNATNLVLALWASGR